MDSVIIFISTYQYYVVGIVSLIIFLKIIIYAVKVFNKSNDEEPSLSRSYYEEEGIPNSFPLVIPVFNHKDLVGPIEDESFFFHGRDSLLKNLKATLKTQKSGCILVSGYKGVGKTSLINKAVFDLKKDSKDTGEEFKEILDLRISLGSSSTLTQHIIFSYLVDELELKFINKVSTLIYDITKNKTKNTTRYGRNFEFIKHRDFLKEFLSDTAINNLCIRHKPFIKLLRTLGINNHSYLYFKLRFYKKVESSIGLRHELEIIISILSQLKWLRIELDKGFIESSREYENYNNSNFETGVETEVGEQNLSFMKTMLKLASTESRKNTSYDKQHRETGNIQRVEKGFARIIDQIDGFSFCGSGRFSTIIVFDELDKVRSGGRGINQEILDRKLEIDRLLDNSKNFLTTCKSLFIFVGDRDLFEATKRYRKDRGTHSGIFRKTILVESYVTDHSDGDESRLATMIESFLVKRLLPESETKGEAYPKTSDIYKYYTQCKIGSKDKEFRQKPLAEQKELFSSDKERHLRMDLLLIQHLIHYITFNSKGIASGVNDVYQSFIRGIDDTYHGRYKVKELLPKYLEPDQVRELKYVLVINERRLPELKWSSDNYIILHRRMSWLLSKYDDKVVVSIFSIFHHIQKLYFIGFERKDVERTSELLNIHREEGLDRLVRTMLGTIFEPSIHQYDGLLSQFRFVSLFQQEIRYILSVTDKDSFDYQFTQEELLPIMQHYLGNSFSGTDGLSLEIQEIKNVNDLIVLGYLSSLIRKHEDAIKCFREAEKVIDKRRERDELSLELLQDHVKIKLRIANSMERALGSKQDIMNVYTQNLVLLRQYKDKHTNGKSILDRVLSGDGISNRKIDLSKNINYLQQKVYFSRLFMMLKENPSKLLRKTKKRINDICEKYENEDPLLYSSPNLVIKNEKRHERTLESLMEYARLMFFANQNREAIRLHILVIEMSDILKYTRRSFVMTGGLALQRIGISLNVFFMSQLHKEQLYSSNYNMVRSESDSKKELCDKFIKNICVQINTMKEVESVDELIEKVYSSSECDGVQKLWSTEKERINDFIDENSTEIFDPSKFDLSRSLSHIALAAKKMEMVKEYRASAEAYMTIVFIWGMYLEFVPWTLLDEDKRGAESLSNSISKLMLDLGKKAGRCIALANNKSYSNFIHSYWYGMLEENNTPNDFDISRLVNPIETLFDRYSSLDKAEEDVQQYVDEPVFWEHSLTGKLLIDLLLWENRSRSSMIKMHDYHKIDFLRIDHTLPYSIKSYITSLWVTSRQQLGDAQKEKGTEEGLKKVIKISACAIENLYQAINISERVTGDYQDIVFPPPYLLRYNLWEVLYNLLHKYLDYIDTKDGKEKKRFKDKRELSYIVKKLLIDHQAVKENKFNPEIPSIYMNYLRVKGDASKELSISENFGDISGSPVESLLATKRYQESDFDDNYLYLDWSCYQMFGGASVIHILAIKRRDDMLKEKIKVTNDYK